MDLLSGVAKVFSFIPRLVVHKAEVQRIFNPDQRTNQTAHLSVDGDEEAPPQSTDVQVSSGSIFLRGVVPDVAALRTAIRQMALELPENMRTAPMLIAKLAADLPSALANMAAEFPSNLMNAATDLPTTIISLAEGVEGTLENIIQISTDVAREVVELPHRASYEWKQLIWVLCLLLFVPVFIFGLVFFIPMNSVNDGVENNRTFVYGIMTFYQLLTMAPWIETCNFAMPEAKIPVKARMLTLLFGLFIAKVYDAALTEGWLGRSIFPIPFSIVVSGMLGVSFVVPLLYMMTPKREKAGFGRMQSVLFAYWISLLMVIAWAVGIQRLMGRPLWQSALTFLYGPLRFVCKILIAAPITTNHNPNRWIQLNLVVDILFTRVQVATFPFIESYITLILLFSTEVLTLAWRYYNGIDRLALWWNAMWMVANHDDEIEATNSFGRKTMTDITKRCFRAPIPHIAQLNLSLREKNFKPERIMRTLTGDTDSMSFDEEESETVFPPRRYEGETDSADGVSPANIDASRSASVVMDIEAACEAADHQAGTRIDPNESIATIAHISQTAEHTDLEESAAKSCLKATSVDESGVHANDGAIRQRVIDGTVATESNRSEGTERDSSRSIFAPESNDLSEEDWEQRPLYHVVDSTGSNVISIIVRVNQQLSMTMVRNLPISNHLNESFQISDERWRKAQIFGWTFIALMLILLVLLGCTFFRRLQKVEGKKLSLSRVMSYLYKDHFWFFFLWLVSTGAFVCASMVNHFGADFSFRFQWIACPEKIAWPSCPV
jgi:hypothetical protein